MKTFKLTICRKDGREETIERAQFIDADWIGLMMELNARGTPTDDEFEFKDLATGKRRSVLPRHVLRFEEE